MQCVSLPYPEHLAFAPQEIIGAHARVCVAWGRPKLALASCPVRRAGAGAMGTMDCPPGHCGLGKRASWTNV